jgi:DNA-binding ferritin-like protein
MRICQIILGQSIKMQRRIIMSWFDSVADRIKNFGGIGAATANTLTTVGAHAIGPEITDAMGDEIADVLEQNKADTEKGRSYINEFWKDVTSDDSKQGSMLGALEVGAAGAATLANEATFGQAGALGVQAGEFAADAKAWLERIKTAHQTARQTAEANETKSAKGMFTSLADSVKRSVEDIQSRVQEHETATPIADAFKAGFESVADAAKRVGEDVHEHAEASPIIDAFKNATIGAAAGAVASAAAAAKHGATPARDASELDYITQAAASVASELEGGK